MTRIFKVDFFVTEKYNGKDSVTLRESKSVKANDAAHALLLVADKRMKPGSYIDDETKKKVSITKHKFDPINVTLVAEAD